MDMNRFTERVQDALRAAQAEATRYHHQLLDVEHLLLALLKQDGGLGAAMLTKAGVPADLLQQRLEDELNRMLKVTVGAGGPPDQIYVTGRLASGPGRRRSLPGHRQERGNAKT